MYFSKINVVITELTASLNFTDELDALRNLSGMLGIIWINGGNCRAILADQFNELLRTATLFTQLEDETEIKKGQPPQHRIYWDDCPKIPSDLSELLKNNTGDQSDDTSVHH
jgi:hypothetical protein